MIPAASTNTEGAPLPADTDILPEVEAPPATDRPLHLILIDGSGFIFRAYHALPPMTRPDGTPVNAVFGFTNMLAKLLREHVSSDKDLMQLIRPGVEMLDPIKQKPIGPPEVMEKFGVTPNKMAEVQALIGDSVDNVPVHPFALRSLMAGSRYA